MDEVAPSFASDEAAVFWRYLSSSLDRLVELTTAADPRALGWRPQTPAGANSLAGLATHTLGNTEENILGVLAGRPVDRDHEREFATVPSQAAIAARWRDLRPRLLSVLCRLPPEELARPRTHPRRGTITAREVLLVVARHAAEHLGQAELTRDLWLAAPNPAS